MSRPRLLDLFCGAGGSAAGYAQAGFEVVGVDHKPQPCYPFTHVQADALDFATSADLSRFAAIHASPPCHAHTTLGNRWANPTSPALIAATRALLEASGLPWIIENVPGAKSEMRSPIQLTGEMFGLGVHRPRLFESNVMLLAPPRAAKQRDPAAVYGHQYGRHLWTRKDGTELRGARLEPARIAMGMPWADWPGLVGAIPPAYTEHLGAQLMAYVLAVAP